MTTSEVKLAVATAAGSVTANANFSALSKDAVGFSRPAAAERPTPFIEVDEQRLTHNMRNMQQRADAAGVLLFPHVETHKSLYVARQQMALGAGGVTASKPSEAVSRLRYRPGGKSASSD